MMDSDSKPNDSGDLTVIGSAHLSEAYFEHIEDTIRDREPDIVAVELDQQRIAQLFSETESSTADVFRQFSVRAGLLYLILSYTQKRLANTIGIDPDMNDMRAAVETAAETDSKVALIDRNITTTLERVSDQLSVLTLGRMWARSRRLDADEYPVGSVQDVLAGLDNSDVFAEYRDFVERVLPEVAEAFIHERDTIMARRLYAFERSGYDVVAVVGGAHEPGIRTELESLRSTEDEGMALSSPLVEVD